MTSPRALSWENFRSTVLLPGQQRVHRVTESPLVEIFGDGVSGRIGIWLETDPATVLPDEVSNLALVTAGIVKRESGSFLEIATAISSLHREFYHFAVALAERVIVEKRSAIDAAILELRCFTDLLEEKSFLGPERQIGLIGELLFLQRLLDKLGTGALDSWIGPAGEPHDFRLGTREFEIKTTISPHRIHTIHGTEQLLPSKGCSLCLVSILLGPPGAGTGFSLSGIIENLSAGFAVAPNRLSQFNKYVRTCGIKDADRSRYTRHFTMRRPIAVARVDNSFPAITRPTIQHALGARASRIESLQYEVNIEGLESEDGTSEFATVIPS